MVESRPRALMHAHASIGGTMRPLLVVCEATSAASLWAGMRSVLGRHAVLVGPGLGWPCDGGARPQERVIGESTIAVIILHPPILSILETFVVSVCLSLNMATHPLRDVLLVPLGRTGHAGHAPIASHGAALT